MKESDKTRDYYIDNVKAILIFLVVFGHISMRFSYIPIVKALKLFVYVFHMPCFVFVSGYLAKGALKNNRFRSDKIISFLWLYVIFKVLMALCSKITGSGFDLELFRDGAAPWYLISMAVWYLMIPFFVSIKPMLVIIGSFAAGIMAGYLEIFDTAFSMSRNFVFLPFFVLGLFVNADQLKNFREKKRLKIAALVLLSVLLVFFVVNLETLSPYLKIVYGARGYMHIETLPRMLYGGVWRLGWYLAAALLSALILLLVPSRKCFISKYGARTLQIYILHILIRNTLAGFGFFLWCKELPRAISMLICFGGSVLLTIILGNRWLEKVFSFLSGGALFKKILK